MVQTQKHLTVRRGFARGTVYDKTLKRWKEITHAITTHICRDMVPIYTVEKRGFKRILWNVKTSQHYMKKIKVGRQVKCGNLSRRMVYVCNSTYLHKVTPMEGIQLEKSDLIFYYA